MPIPTHAKIRLAGPTFEGWLYGLPEGLSRDPAVGDVVSGAPEGRRWRT